MYSVHSHTVHTILLRHKPTNTLRTFPPSPGFSSLSIRHTSLQPILQTQLTARTSPLNLKYFAHPTPPQTGTHNAHHAPQSKTLCTPHTSFLSLPLSQIDVPQCVMHIKKSAGCSPAGAHLHLLNTPQLATSGLFLFDFLLCSMSLRARE
jgi:hypothetical protein